MDYILPDLNLLEVKSSYSDGGNTGTFIIEPLSPGYGVTIGNTLRRILLASLEGSAIRSVRISGVDHEYSTIKGVKEDVVELILNLKLARFSIDGNDPVKLRLSAKGPKVVTTDDFEKKAGVEVVSEKHYIATLEKGAKLDLEVEIDKGRGYVPVERRSDEKVPIGTILVDSIYTPVKKVRYEVENTRVGGMTNYNRLILEITTDGSISPSKALSIASQIMTEHLQVIIGACEAEEKAPKGDSKPKTKSKSKSKSQK